MTYIVTMNPGTEDEVAKVIEDDMIHNVLRYRFPPYGDLAPGQAIQIRRADYLDTEVVDEIVFERPKLVLIQGGNT